MSYRDMVRFWVSCLLDFADVHLRGKADDFCWVKVRDSGLIFDFNSCKVRLPSFSELFEIQMVDGFVLEEENVFRDFFVGSFIEGGSIRKDYSRIIKLREEHDWLGAFLDFLQDEFAFTLDEAIGFIREILSTYVGNYYKSSREELLEEFTDLALVSIKKHILGFSTEFMMNALIVLSRFNKSKRITIVTEKSFWELFELECGRRGVDSSVMKERLKKLDNEIEPLKFRYALYFSGICLSEDFGVGLLDNVVLRVPRVSDFF